MSAEQLATFAEQHRTVALVAGGLALVVLIWLGRVARKHGRNGATYRWLAGAVAVALSAEGMWEVATEALHLQPWKAALLFAFGELAMLNEAKKAKLRVQDNKPAGIHATAVWFIAIGIGLIAATNAGSVTEVVIRFGAPTLIAWQWYSDLVEDRERQSSRWIWTPSRLGIHLGLLRPGDADDLGEVFRERRIERMVRLADRIDTSGRLLAGRRALRLRRMAQAADEALLAEVTARYRRGTTVQEAVFGRVRVEITDRLAQGDAPAPTQVDAAVTQAADAPADAVAAHPADAPASPTTQPAGPAVRQVDAPPRRNGRIVMTRPVSAPPADRDAALKLAVDAVLTQGLPIRAAASDAALPEATVRRKVKAIRESNGHSFNPTTDDRAAV